MPKTVQITVPPEEAADLEVLKWKASEQLHIEAARVTDILIIKRSIDARNKHIKINLTLEAYIDGEQPVPKTVSSNYKKVNSKKSVIIIGAGPAGLFAALELIKEGIKPVIIERGKDVRSRRRDLAKLNKEHIVNPNSNYCFGEGGAGTYSDGKLYTRSGKRGDVESILNTFVEHGASREILVEAHPHIGTNKLPHIIVQMRETILNHGGEIYFNMLLTDFTIKNETVSAVVCQDLTDNTFKEFIGDAVILATGHSARDIYELLNKKNVLIEAKPFAMGVRVEHPQDLIDSMQYHCNIKEVPEKRKYLPAAPYSWVEQVNDRGVYSFCMCPGGIIAPCATQQEEVVTNGWSPSKRNNPFANSGIVVGIDLKDLENYKQHGPLAGLRYQQELEHKAWEAGGKTQTAPAQRLLDFLKNKISSTLPTTSYQPGVKSVALHELLPKDISIRLQAGFKAYGIKKKDYLSTEAVIVGVESRTSSPVRIPRDKEALAHPQVKNLYPCGEGGGYAGGIVSAAMDGVRVAKIIKEKITQKTSV